MSFRANTRLAYGAAVAVLLLAACTSATSSTSSAEALTTTSSTSSAEAPTTTQRASETTEPAGAADVLAKAVDALIEAGSYAFEAKTIITIQDQPVEVEIEGWVDGSDRELTTKIDGQSVTTRVIDGVATVERDGESVEVGLQEADAAPSLLILKSIQAPTFDDPTTVVGKLNSSDLSTTNFDANGAASVEVRLDSDGNLTGYTILANNESWSIEVKLFDIGDNFTP